MIVNAWQLPSQRDASEVNEQLSSLFQASSTLHLRFDHEPELVHEFHQVRAKRTIPCTLIFLVVMAAVSLAFDICGRLIGPALLSRFGLSLDPVSLSVARQSIVALLGIGLAGCFSKHAPDSAQRQHMLLTPLLAMAVGVILAWLSQLVGQSNALDWLVILVYLVWAWGSAVSAARG
jgi:hypothetical protein